MDPLDFVKLSTVMAITSGKPEIVVGLLDGPVATDHPDLVDGNIKVIPGKIAGFCGQAGNSTCLHGTFIAGILCARRGSIAPAICPDCTLLVRPIFSDATADFARMPGATPAELAEGIIEAIETGARVINLSVSLAQTVSKGQRELEEALDYSASQGVIVVAAAGNQGTLGSSVITRHPWVISVVAYGRQGKPIAETNLGSSIAKRGLAAPGEDITSLGAGGKSLTLGGTSAATPFVTGAIALLWSEFPSASAADIKFAVVQGCSSRRITVIPPLLDAAAAYQMLQNSYRRN